MIFNMIGGGNDGGASLNFKVVGGTSTPASPKENTIWVNTDTEITGWEFSAEDPFSRDLLDRVTLGNGYLSSSGAITSQTAASPELYTEDYIPVKFGSSYRWDYRVSAQNTMWLAIVEYTEGNTFKQRLVPVNSTGIYQTGIYMPSSSDVIAVRLSWNTFPDTTYEMKFIGLDAENTDESRNGFIWFPTGTYHTLIRFNALKKNGIMIYPKSARQWIDGAWVDKTVKIYQNNEWADWARYIFQSGKGPIVPIVQYGCNKGKATHTVDSIVHSRYNSGSDYSVTSTEDAVELNGYSMIYARANCTSNYGEGKNLGICLSSTKPSSNFGDITYAAVRPDIAITGFSANSIETVYSLPIPSGLAAAYIWIHGNGKAEIYDIWME